MTIDKKRSSLEWQKVLDESEKRPLILLLKQRVE